MDEANTRICPTCKCAGDVSPVGPGRDRNCRACRSKAQKERYHRDPKARALQIARSMNDSMKHRSTTVAVVNPHQIVKLIMSSPHCHYCQLPNTEFGRGFHVDHYVPLADGGMHELGNLVMCCEMCDRAKWNHSPEKYRAWLLGVSQRLRQE